MNCAKCGGNALDVPCAYPDFNFRDCGHPAVEYLRTRIVRPAQEGKALAWVVSYKEGKPLHLCRADGWEIEEVLMEPTK